MPLRRFHLAFSNYGLGWTTDLQGSGYGVKRAPDASGEGPEALIIEAGTG